MVNVSLASNVINEIQNYMAKFGGYYSDWYCGVASVPRDRLFNAHNVNEQNGIWIYNDCGNDDTAREVEAHFLNKGCKGGDGGGSWQSKYVYAYKITADTIE